MRLCVQKTSGASARTALCGAAVPPRHVSSAAPRSATRRSGTPSARPRPRNTALQRCQGWCCHRPWTQHRPAFILLSDPPEWRWWSPEQPEATAVRGRQPLGGVTSCARGGTESRQSPGGILYTTPGNEPALTRAQCSGADLL